MCALPGCRGSRHRPRLHSGPCSTVCRHQYAPATVSMEEDRNAHTPSVIPYPATSSLCPSAVAPPWLPIAGTMNGSPPAAFTASTIALMVSDIGNASAAGGYRYALTLPTVVSRCAAAKPLPPPTPHRAILRRKPCFTLTIRGSRTQGPSSLPISASRTRGSDAATMSVSAGSWT